MIEEAVKRIHPNRLSFAGGLLSIIGTGLLTSPTTDCYGAGLIAVGQGVDLIDGHLARRYGLRTKQGARLDPLLDKLKNVALTGYIAVGEFIRGDYLMPVAVVANWAVDIVSQRARGPLDAQLGEALNAVVHPEMCTPDMDIESSVRANKFGKLKVAFQNLAIFGYVAAQLYSNHISALSDQIKSSLNCGFTGLLAASAILGSIGIIKRLRKKRV